MTGAARAAHAAALAGAIAIAGCAREGIEPPALTLSRWVGTLPCAGGGSGAADLTLHEVVASGEPTMYDLLLTCADSLPAEALRGAWARDSAAPATVVLEREAPAASWRLIRRGSDSLVAPEPVGVADRLSAVLIRVSPDS